MRQAGFGLDHDYVEQCWASIMGPSTILLLRRVHELWQDDPSPLIEAKALSGMIGLGGSNGRNGALWRTFDRMDRFGLATINGIGDISIFTEVPPLSKHQLGRCPAWTRERHYVLLDEHLARLAELDREGAVEHSRSHDHTVDRPSPPAAMATTPAIAR